MGIVEGISSSKVDFGIIPPFVYVLANKESNAQVILKALNKRGKSSLMKAINLLVKPKSGSIRINNEEMINLSSKELRLKRRKIGFIFQDYNLVERLSVIENVLTGRLGYKSSLKSLLGIFSKEEYEKAEEALKKLDF